ncbi:hypothetical protein JKP88DRAFT_347614 [Tribonema minus]|uniref:Uncharacterized protein n=1 Tax=Tribonema minus TaxID=303371 RepID=A0A836CK63_9STRA|nr:hypothetical protein JKP88DRAFT_347614 [Tribonema minus]
METVYDGDDSSDGSDTLLSTPSGSAPVMPTAVAAAAAAAAAVAAAHCQLALATFDAVLHERPALERKRCALAALRAAAEHALGRLHYKAVPASAATAFLWQMTVSLIVAEAAPVDLVVNVNSACKRERSRWM